MKFSKSHIIAVLPLIFVLTGCATTEENGVSASATILEVTPAVAAPVAKPAVAPQEVIPEHCSNHQAAVNEIKHDCVQHCKTAKGKKGKACIAHCEHEALNQHNCETHCANHPNNHDSACAKHCADATDHSTHCAHHEYCSGDKCSKHADHAHTCSKQHCAQHGGAMDACCGEPEHNCEQHCAQHPGSNDPACLKHCQDHQKHSAQSAAGHCGHHS